MARTVDVWTYANQVSADMTRDRFIICAEVLNDGVLEAGVPVRFWTTGGIVNFDETAVTSDGSGEGDDLGRTFVQWLVGTNETTFLENLFASVDAGFSVDSYGTITWNHYPSGFFPPDRSSPAPVLTATPLPETNPSTGNFRLDWTAVPSPDSHYRTYYYLERGDSPTGPWHPESTFAPYPTTVTTETFTSWTFGTYYYRVLGKEPTFGSGTYSSVVTVVVSPAVIVSTGAAWGRLAG